MIITHTYSLHFQKHANESIILLYPTSSTMNIFTGTILTTWLPTHSEGGLILCGFSTRYQHLLIAHGAYSCFDRNLNATLSATLFFCWLSVIGQYKDKSGLYQELLKCLFTRYFSRANSYQ